MKSSSGLKRTDPVRYEIIIQGRLVEGWSDWMDDLKIVTNRNAEGTTFTALTGMVKDQAGLHGLLNRIRDLNIPLVSVQYIKPIHYAKE